MIERRFVTTPRMSIERREGQSPKLVGYAAVWYDGTPGTEYELYRDVTERVQMGAFAKHVAENADVVGLFNHAADAVLGRRSAGTLRLNEDSVGLRYEIDLGDTVAGSDVAKMVERGDVTGSSFGFLPRGVKWQRNDDGTEVRILTDVELFDLGPVTFPAYTATSVGRRSVPSGHIALADVQAEVAEHMRQRAAQKIAAAWKAY